MYEQNQKLTVVKSVIFGETGKAEVNYYFDTENDKRYLVEMTDYSYNAPISAGDVKIASTRSYNFVVCDGVKPNYPNSSDMTDVYKRAVSILSAIRSSLE